MLEGTFMHRRRGVFLWSKTLFHIEKGELETEE